MALKTIGLFILINSLGWAIEEEDQVVPSYPPDGVPSLSFSLLINQDEAIVPESLQKPKDLAEDFPLPSFFETLSNGT